MWAARTRLYKSWRLARVDAENRPGVVVILNVTDIGAAQATLEALLLGQGVPDNLRTLPDRAVETAAPVLEVIGRGCGGAEGDRSTP